MSAPTVMDMTQRKGPAGFGGAKGSSLRKEGLPHRGNSEVPRLFLTSGAKEGPPSGRRGQVLGMRKGEGAPPAPQAIRHCPRFPRQVRCDFAATKGVASRYTGSARVS